MLDDGGRFHIDKNSKLCLRHCDQSRRNRLFLLFPTMPLLFVHQNFETDSREGVFSETANFKFQTLTVQTLFFSFFVTILIIRPPMVLFQCEFCRPKPEKPKPFKRLSFGLSSYVCVVYTRSSHIVLSKSFFACCQAKFCPQKTLDFSFRLLRWLPARIWLLSIVTASLPTCFTEESFDFHFRTISPTTFCFFSSLCSFFGVFSRCCWQRVDQRDRTRRRRL